MTSRLTTQDLVRDRRDRLGMFRFDAKLTLPRAGGVHHGHHARQHLRGEVEHQFGVFVNERLAFGAIGDHELNLRLRV